MKDRNKEDAKEILEIINNNFNTSFYSFYNKRIYKYKNKNNYNDVMLYNIIYNSKNFYIVYINFYKYTENVVGDTLFLYDDLKEAEQKYLELKEVDYYLRDLEKYGHQELDEDDKDFLNLFK